MAKRLTSPASILWRYLSEILWIVAGAIGLIILVGIVSGHDILPANAGFMLTFTSLFAGSMVYKVQTDRRVAELEARLRKQAVDPARIAAALPLRPVAEQLGCLIDDMYHPPIPHRRDDTYARMLLDFTAKEGEHLKSVCVLVDHGLVRDANLVARTMLEGAVALLWVSEAPKRRSMQWAVYAWVQDLERLRAQRREGAPADPHTEQAIRDQLGRYGHLLRKGGARTEDPLAVRYHARWHEKSSVRALFEDVKSEEGHNLLPYYDNMYSEVSNWVHWNPRGLAFAIQRQGVNVEYHKGTRHDAPRALWIAVTSALIAARLLDNHARLGYAGALTEVRRELDTWEAAMQQEEHP